MYEVQSDDSLGVGLLSKQAYLKRVTVAQKHHLLQNINNCTSPCQRKYLYRVYKLCLCQQRTREDTNNVFEELREVELPSLLYGGNDGGKHLFLLGPLVLYQHQQLTQSLLVLVISQRDVLDQCTRITLKVTL